MGMQALIYSDSEYQAYKDSIFKFYTGLDEKGYMIASASQLALGNYSEEDITTLGTIGQIATGVIGADLPADLRDLAYDLQHWNELVKENPGQIALDVTGVLPVIGVLKYGDETALVLKNADGTIEKIIKPIASVSKGTLKHIVNEHTPSVWAQQLNHLPKEMALQKLEGKTFFNKNWSSAQIEEAINQGYSEACRKGITNDTYDFKYMGETITIAIRDGNIRTAYGDYKYSYEELLSIVE